MSLNFLNSIPLFSRGVLKIHVSDKNFKFIFTYFYSILLGYSKQGQIKFQDFRTVFLATLYLRLNSNNAAICGHILNQTAGYGILPGFSRLACLLPLNGIVNFAGFTVLHFQFSDYLEKEVLSWVGTSTLHFAIRDLRNGSNYDRILFEPVKVFEKNTVTFTSFFVNMCPETKKEIEFDDDYKNANPFWFVGKILCVASATSEMSLSLAATVLFSLHINFSQFNDFCICFGCKYMNLVDTEIQCSDLVTSALVTVFGNNNVNFGREDYTTIEPGNRVVRKSFSDKYSTPGRVGTPPTSTKDSSKLARNKDSETQVGTPPIPTADLQKIVKFVKSIRTMTHERFGLLISNIELLFVQPQLI
jgi:hypothetical protein